MSWLSSEQLVRIVASEGKLAGASWIEFDDVEPWLIAAHRDCVLRELAPLTVGMPGDLVQTLKTNYDEAIAASRAKFGEFHEQPPLDPMAVRHRLQPQILGALEGSGSGDTWWFDPSEEVKLLVAALGDEPDGHIPFDLAATIYSEVGRLSGPLWVSGSVENLPGAPNAASEVIADAVAERLPPLRVFDPATSDYREVAVPEQIERLLDTLLNAMDWARALYFRQHPVGLPLPRQSAELAAEELRRAAERTHVVETAQTAVENLVAPIAVAVHERLELRERKRLEREAEQRALRASHGFDHPGAQRFGVSHRGAEIWVRDLLRHLGAGDAEVTPPQGDGGADVISGDFVVSVKHYTGTVPVEEVREIFAVGAASSKTAVLWTSGTLTNAGIDFAEAAPVAVVRYSVEEGTFEPEGEAGRLFLEGLERA